MQKPEDGEVKQDVTSEAGGGYDGSEMGRGGRGGRGGRFGRDGGRGRGEGRGRGRPEDPDQCPIVLDRDGKLMLKATVMIMRELAGAVIGRGGEHVAAIRAETGALVHVCKPDFNTGVQGVDIFGNLPKIHLAQSKISSVLRDNAPEWSSDKEWGPRLKVQLLPDMVGTIIGKRGANVQRINNESGAMCRVNNQSDDSSLQLVQFYGTEEQVCRAFAMFLETLESYDVTQSKTIEKLSLEWRGSNGFRRDDGYRPRASYYDDRRGGGYGDRGGYGRGYGGPDRGYGGRDGGYTNGSRYEPYGGSDRGYGGRGAGGYGRREERRDDRGGYGPPRDNGGYGMPQPMVVLPQQQAPPAQPAMPTVLIQQADGTLVQAQVMTQPAAGQTTGYSVVQPQHAAAPAVAAQPGIQPGYTTQPAYNVQYAQPAPTAAVPAGGAGMYSYATVKPDAEPAQLYAAPANGQGMYSVAAAPATQVKPAQAGYNPVPQTQTSYQQ